MTGHRQIRGKSACALSTYVHKWRSKALSKYLPENKLHLHCMSASNDSLIL